jgi:hypothetical protein
MARIIRRDFGFSGKLFFAVTTAISVGFLWALWDTGTSPVALAKAFTSSPEPKPDPVKEAAKGPPKDPAKEPVKDPVRPPPKDPPKDPPKEAPRSYDGGFMAAFFTEVDGHLRYGRLKEARDAVGRLNKLLVPMDQLARYREFETRVEGLWRLIQETTPGALLELPQMAQIVFKGGGTSGVFVKNVVETATEYRFETLDGIRSRRAKADVSEFRRLPDGARTAAIDMELEKKAGYKGIKIAWKDDAHSDMSFEHASGRKVEGIHYFELADFCARNGANKRLGPLFQQAWNLDPNIIDTVHEAKADALVNVLIYFISIRSKEDAKWTLGVLNQRYKTTRAFLEKVEQDDELKKHYESLFDTGAIAKHTDPPKRPDPVRQPDPVTQPDPAKRPDPIKPPDPSKQPDPAKQPDPVKPDPPDLERTDEPRPVEAGATQLPETAPARAKELVKKGDAAYAEAMKHLLNSDPNLNPDGWGAENRKALDAFTAAFESYSQAQDMFGSEVPQSLLKRFRDTQMSRSLCRKRAQSTKK